jgi:uncharacterized protein
LKQSIETLIDAKPSVIFFWRRIDQPGHDCCRIFELSGRWVLNGGAVFTEKRRRCYLQYEVVTDAAWNTKHATITGFVGNWTIDLRIRASSKQQWFLNDEAQVGVNGCLDLDLGFTPATNLIAIRRLSLSIGEQVDAPAAYLTFPNMRLKVLQQTYRRSGRLEYDYAAPSFGYNGKLKASLLGAIVHYPGLFDQLK